jgi:TolA-binding protein
MFAHVPIRKRIVTLALCVLGVAFAPAQESPDPALRQYLAANGFLNRGLYEMAASEYEAFLKSHPRHEKADIAGYGLVVCRFRLGEHKDALPLLAGLQNAQAFPFAAEVLAMSGQAQLALGQPQEAAQSFARLLRSNGDHALADDAAGLLVEAFYAGGEYQSAIEVAGAFAQRWPESALRERAWFFGGCAHCGLGDWEEGAKLFTRLLEANAESEFAEQAMYMLAQSCDERNLLDQAARWYRRLLERNTGENLPDAMLALAGIAHQQGDLDEAEALLDRFDKTHADHAIAPDAAFLRGRVAFDRGQYREAAAIFAALAENSSLAAQVAYWLPKSELRDGKFDDAAERLSKAIDVHADSKLLPEMRYDLAVALLRSGKDEAAAEALAAFRQHHAKHRLAADALHLLAGVAHRLARYDDSQKHCRALLERYPEHAQVEAATFLLAENDYLRGRLAEALLAYRAFVQAYPEASSADQARFRMGMTLYQLEKYDEALETLQPIAEQAGNEPVYRPSLLAVGDICFLRGEWKQAEHWLQAYLSGGDDVAAASDALLKLGLTMQRQQRFADALAVYDHLLATFPADAAVKQAMFERGQSLVALKREGEAAEAFESILATAEHSRFAPFARNHLAALALGGGDYEQAADLFGRVVAATDDADVSAEARMQRGQALLAGGRYEQAERAFKDFFNHHTRHARAPLAAAQLGLAIARQDRAKDALPVLRGVIDDDAVDASTRASVLQELAWCLKKLDQPELAAEALGELIQMAPTEPVQQARALFELAEMRADDGHYDEAITLLERVVAADNHETALPRELRAAAGYRLGVCLFREEQFERAAATLEDFLKANETPALVASARFFAGEALLKIGRPAAAAKHLGRVVEDFADSDVFAPALLRLGECHAALQEWVPAEQVFTRYLQRFGDSDLAYQARFSVGWSRENQQRWDEAIAAYREVVEHHDGPTAARAQFQIGECLFAKKQLDEAVRELLRVEILYAYPEWSAAALYEAGRCFEQLGKPIEARRQFKACQEKYGGTKWAELSQARLAAVTDTGLPGRGG